MDNGIRRSIRKLAQDDGAIWAQTDMTLQGIEDEVCEMLHLEAKVSDIGFGNVLLGIKFDLVDVYVEIGCLQRGEVAQVVDMIRTLYTRNICIEDFIKDLKDYIGTNYIDILANLPKMKFCNAVER